MKNRFLEIFYLDTRSLSLLRILLGCVCLYNVLSFLPWASTFFAERGFLPVSVLNQFSARWSLHYINHTLVWQYLLLIAMLLCSVALIFGYKTRVVLLILWILTVSFSNRAFPLENGGHSVLRMVLFWCMFLPLDSHFTWFKKSNSITPAGRIASFASAGLILQFILIYFFAGITKNDAAWRSSFDAVYKTLHLSMFAKPFGAWLTDFFWLTQFLTIATLIIEIFVPFILLITLRAGIFRLAAVVVLLLFQAGIFLSYKLGVFPFIMISYTLVFLPSLFWDKFVFKKPITSQFIFDSRKYVQVFCAVMIVLTWWNSFHNTYRNTKWLRMPTSLENIVNLTRTDQRWWMFTHKNWFDYWISLKGVTQSGQSIDALSWYRERAYKDFTLDKPDNVLADLVKDSIWQKYLHEAKARKNIGDWFLYNICLDFNAKNPQDPILQVELFESSRYIAGYNDVRPVRVKKINTRKCDLQDPSLLRLSKK